MSGAGFPWLRFIAVSVGITGFGYALMKVVTPSPEQLYQRLSPDLQRQVDARRAQTQAAEAARRQLLEARAAEAADSSSHTKGSSGDAEKPIWANTPSHPSSASRQ